MKPLLRLPLLLTFLTVTRKDKNKRSSTPLSQKFKKQIEKTESQSNNETSAPLKKQKPRNKRKTMNPKKQRKKKEKHTETFH